MGIQQMLMVGPSQQVILNQDIDAGFFNNPFSDPMAGYWSGYGGSVEDPIVTYNGSAIGDLIVAAQDGGNTWITIWYYFSAPPEEYIKDFKINGTSILGNFLEFFWELHGPDHGTYLFSGTSGITELTTFNLELIAE